MSTTEILESLRQKYEEHLEMMSPQEQSDFMIKVLTNLVLQQKGTIQHLIKAAEVE